MQILEISDLKNKFALKNVNFKKQKKSFFPIKIIAKKIFQNLDKSKQTDKAQLALRRISMPLR